MCLAVPSKIIEIDGYMATVDVMGLRKQVSLLLLPEEPKIGEYVLVHAGFAINKMEPAEAEEALKIFEKIFKEMEEQEKNWQTEV
ncbi:MAG: HypC/HybG/HupF family hydrogenase formation chaperone [Thermodesulfovibrio sp.]|uniref:HypC/HybG/HupF family hydrogenase formation chaperone n=1 Tax=unclassified Thermodesulfovibrio TaxID=2645936 RepID=UPI00083AC867|nr:MULTISPECIES: HypC/HybG/HupF family hydrogenase formation chaperone [unclassified Thermodesulfovibrio]MDI1471092.1 HypC/HybG/HupF family hydrogenase formation chaperone [Thermodesulfovibrio sp. 1176]MDI6713942.1 HypC/HybG/HupF family hydrogenase formation chaperone [Thermodesulfovibrio sp.]ODA44356.1 [NiFe] hydrogenase metallocenter assembly protein HypC [Thermodesulfovibrio sp. N1]